MAEEKKNAEPGDVVELKDKTAGFTDPETGFDISREQKLELTEPIGAATHRAVLTGGLMIVSGKAAKADAKQTKEQEEQAAADAQARASAPAPAAPAVAPAAAPAKTAAPAKSAAKKSSRG